MRGIIIKSLDYKEKSKIVFIYTILGLKGYKVIGIKGKKNVVAGNLTTGNIIDFTYTDSQFPSLVEFDTIKSNLDCSNNFDTIDVLRVMIEVINYLPEDAPHKLMYQFIEDAFMNILNINPYKVLSIFLIKMLYPFGVSPNLKSCSKCGKKTDLIGFSIVDGGVLCNNCCSGYNDLLKYWSIYYYSKDNILKLDDCNFKELLKEINKYYLINVHMNLKLHL